MINAVDGTGRLRSAMTAMPPGLIQRFEVLKPFIDTSKHLPRGRESPWEEARPVERLGPQEHR